MGASGAKRRAVVERRLPVADRLDRLEHSLPVGKHEGARSAAERDDALVHHDPRDLRDAHRTREQRSDTLEAREPVGRRSLRREEQRAVACLRVQPPDRLDEGDLVAPQLASGVERRAESPLHRTGGEGRHDLRPARPDRLDHDRLARAKRAPDGLVGVGGDRRAAGGHRDRAACTGGERRDVTVPDVHGRRPGVRRAESRLDDRIVDRAGGRRCRESGGDRLEPTGPVASQLGDRQQVRAFERLPAEIDDRRDEPALLVVEPLALGEEGDEEPRSPPDPERERAERAPRRRGEDLAEEGERLLGGVPLVEPDALGAAGGERAGKLGVDGHSAPAPERVRLRVAGRHAPERGRPADRGGDRATRGADACEALPDRDVDHLLGGRGRREAGGDALERFGALRRDPCGALERRSLLPQLLGPGGVRHARRRRLAGRAVARRAGRTPRRCRDRGSGGPSRGRPRGGAPPRTLRSPPGRSRRTCRWGCRG